MLQRKAPAATPITQVISEKERAMLDRLRIKLAILPADAVAVGDLRGERAAAVAA